MKLKHALVLRGFARGKQEKVILCARAVVNLMYPQAVFANPPVAVVDLEAAIAELENAQTAMAQGGTAATALKNQKKAELIELLEELADFVDVKAAGDLAVLLSSGFEARKTTQTRSPLATPLLRGVTNGASGELVASAAPVANARCYEVYAAVVGPDGTPLEWRFHGTATAARKITATGLTPGTMYLLRIRAIGGTTGYSDWSDAMTQRCK